MCSVQCYLLNCSSQLNDDLINDRVIRSSACWFSFHLPLFLVWLIYSILSIKIIFVKNHSAQNFNGPNSQTYYQIQLKRYSVLQQPLLLSHLHSIRLASMQPSVKICDTNDFYALLLPRSIHPTIELLAPGALFESVRFGFKPLHTIIHMMFHSFFFFCDYGQ